MINNCGYGHYIKGNDLRKSSISKFEVNKVFFYIPPPDQTLPKMAQTPKEAWAPDTDLDARDPNNLNNHLQVNCFALVFICINLWWNIYVNLIDEFKETVCRCPADPAAYSAITNCFH